MNDDFSQHGRPYRAIEPIVPVGLPRASSGRDSIRGLFKGPTNLGRQPKEGLMHRRNFIALSDGVVPPGEYSLPFDSSGVTPGMFFAWVMCEAR